jgi:hypothetical protein
MVRPRSTFRSFRVFFLSRAYIRLLLQLLVLSLFFPFGSRSFQFGRKLGTGCCSLCIRCWCESRKVSQDTESQSINVNKQLTAVMTLASRNEIHKFFTSNWLFGGVTREGVCTKRSMSYHLAGADLSQNTGKTYMSVGLAVSHFVLLEERLPVAILDLNLSQKVTR